MPKDATLNSDNTRAAGSSIEYTEEMIEEIKKCMDDPIYFIENYVYIVNVDQGLQLFKLYDCQKKKIQYMLDHRKIIIMEGRQQGKTTTTTAFLLWYTLFHPYKTVIVLANKLAAAHEVLSRYRGMFINLPIWMQNGIKTWNKGAIEMDNESKIYGYATTAAAGRGMSANIVYIDEAAHIATNLANEFLAAIAPTISSGKSTQLILSSTPNGFNHFWQIWDGSIQGHNDYVTLQVHWYEIPGRDEKWKEEQLRELKQKKFNQEILCHFLGSSYTLIDGDCLAKMTPKKAIFEKDGLSIYEIPQPKHRYMITADVASGHGEDSSAYIITDITEFPYRIVGKFKNDHISPLLFPNYIYKAAMEYNEAYVLLEINNNDTVSYILQTELEYENLLFVGRDPKRGQSLGEGFGGSTSIQFGLNMDKKTKRLGCHSIKALIEENQFLIEDADTISELSTFVEKPGGFYAADEGSHDDLVMCLVIFGWAANQPYFNELNNVNIRNKMYEKKMQLIEDELTPFGFHDDGVGGDTGYIPRY